MKSTFVSDSDGGFDNHSKSGQDSLLDLWDSRFHTSDDGQHPVRKRCLSVTACILKEFETILKGISEG